MLEDFARRNGLPNPTHFTDDGISGTRFDRPGFLAMMEEVEAGRVEAIVIKDMCLPFAVAWFFLSAAAVWLENALHRLAEWLAHRRGR